MRTFIAGDDTSGITAALEQWTGGPLLFINNTLPDELVAVSTRLGLSPHQLKLIDYRRVRSLAEAAEITEEHVAATVVIDHVETLFGDDETADNHYLVRVVKQCPNLYVVGTPHNHFLCLMMDSVS